MPSCKRTSKLTRGDTMYAHLGCTWQALAPSCKTPSTLFWRWCVADSPLPTYLLLCTCGSSRQTWYPGNQGSRQKQLTVTEKQVILGNILSRHRRPTPSVIQIEKRAFSVTLSSTVVVVSLPGTPETKPKIPTGNCRKAYSVNRFRPSRQPGWVRNHQQHTVRQAKRQHQSAPGLVTML